MPDMQAPGQRRTIDPIHLWHLRLKLKRHWPYLMWILLVGIAVVMYQRRPEIGLISANVSSDAVELGAPETMLLASIEVTPGQKVRPGDIVARLDTRAIDGEIAMQEALVAQAASVDDYVLRIDDQLAGAVSSAEADLLGAKLEMEQATAEFKVLDEELVKLNKLLDLKFIDAASVSPVRAQHAALAQASRRYPDLVKAHETHLAAARKRHEEGQQWLSRGKTNDVRQEMKARDSAQIDVLKATLNMLKAQRETCILRSPIAGLVSRISFHPGATVIRDEPIVRIAPEKSNEIVAFLREEQARYLTNGMTVYASARGRPGETAAVVTSVAPDVSVMPTRLNRPGEDVDLEIRGRRAILRIVEETDLLPGESVRLRIPAAGFFRLPRFLGGR